jgi:hypothetical protein
MFRKNQALQEEYIKNPSRFIEENVTPREYAVEMQSLTSNLSAKCYSTIDSTLSNLDISPRAHLEASLKALEGGKFKITLSRPTENLA